MKLESWLVAGLILGAAGCKTVTKTAFSPLEVKLETAAGGAKYLLVGNNSGQELHNYGFSVHIWSEHSPRRRWNAKPFGRYDASGASWAVGKTLHFRALQSDMENPITEPISRVEVVGHCDMGHFRQTWVANEFGQLLPREENH